MPKFSCKITTFELDKGRYSKTLKDAVRSQLYQAARAFVATAARAVPVRTGFARGAFNNVLEAAGGKEPGSYSAEQIVGGTILRGEAKSPAEKVFGAFRILKAAIRGGTVKGLGISAANIHQATKGKPGIPLEYYRGGGGKVLKTPQSGRQFATQPKEIFTGSDSDVVFGFNFDIWIDYFNVNDEHSNIHTPSAPWNSFRLGYATFLNYMRSTALKKLPQVNNFLAEVSLKVDGISVTKTKTVMINRDSRFKV